MTRINFLERVKNFKLSRYGMDEKKKKYQGFDNEGMIDQIKGIITWLEKDIEHLKEEYEEVRKMPAPMNSRMMSGITRNIRDRNEDLFDYKNQLHSKMIRAGLT